jgi:hypothetical protein
MLHLLEHMTLSHLRIQCAERVVQEIGVGIPEVALEVALQGVANRVRIQRPRSHLSIQCTERVVQEIGVGVGVQRSGQAEALLLPPAEVDALLPNLRHVAVLEEGEVTVQAARAQHL